MTDHCARCGGSGEEPDNYAIGKRARKARLAQELRLPQVASLVGCSVSYLSDLERGLRLWSGPRAIAYLKLLEVTLVRSKEAEE